MIHEWENEAEVYVQFEKSQSAFQAFKMYQSGILPLSKLLQITPADTWHQPDFNPISDTVYLDACSILNINDDCLLKLFQYLDLDSLVQLSLCCTRLQYLLHRFCFTKIKTHTVFVYQAPVNLLRQTLKCIGPHLESISLRYHKYMNAPQNYMEAEHEERVTFKILQNIGPKLTKLIIRQPTGQMLTSKIVKLFVPIFQQITILEWDSEFNCDTIQDLQALCPCLTSLILKKRIFTCKSDHETAGLDWSSLTNVETFQYMSSLDSPCQQFFERFIQSNPQLKRLKLTNVNENLFWVISQFSQNLEYLEMLQNSNECDIYSQSTLDLIRSMGNLKVLVIRMKTTKYLKDIENQIKCLSRMKHLKLIILVRNYTPPWSRESFPLAHYWTNISIEGHKLKMRIGDNTANIEFSNEKLTLVNVINTNNPNDSSYERLQRDIRCIFGISEQYLPEFQQQLIFENSDCVQHIHVSSVL